MTITVLDRSNVPAGPFTRAQVAEKLQCGEFSLDDLAFIEGLAQWTPLRDVLAQIDGVPPVAPPPFSPALPAYSYAATMAPPPHLVYAGFWPRVAAHIIDNLVVSVPVIIILLVLFAAVVGLGAFTQITRPSGAPSDAASAALVGTVVLLYFTLIVGRIVIVWLYHAMLESGPHQATWGKRVMGLKVTGITGQRITFGHASGRYFSTIVTNMTMGVGYIMAAFTDRKQALHDMIAGTLVVRS